MDFLPAQAVGPSDESNLGGRKNPAFHLLNTEVLKPSVQFHPSHLCMKCSLGISNFLEEISSLSHSVVPHQSKTPFSPPPSGSLHKPLSSLCERADRRSMNHHNPTATKTKPHYRKLIRMKKQKVMSQMKGQDKTPEKNN